MPHLIVDYSRNIERNIDLDEICAKARNAILETGLFEVGAVRVRAHGADFHAVADSHPDNGFVDMVFRIGKGRSDAEKSMVGEKIFAAVAKVVEVLLANPHFALSLEIKEIDPDLSWRKNTMHARLRAA